MRDWIFPTVLTFVSWGFWAFLPKIATKHIDYSSAMVYQVLGGIVVGLVVLISMNFRVEFNPPGFITGLAIGIFGFLGAYTYLISLSRGPLSLVAPISALYPLLAITLGFLIFGETVTLKQGIGIGLSFVAMILIST